MNKLTKLVGYSLIWIGGLMPFNINNIEKGVCQQFTKPQKAIVEREKMPTKIFYEVKEKDNLYDISNMFGLKSWEEVFELNKNQIKNPKLIFPYQRIMIENPTKIPYGYIRDNGYVVPKTTFIFKEIKKLKTKSKEISKKISAKEKEINEIKKSIKIYSDKIEEFKEGKLAEQKKKTSKRIKEQPEDKRGWLRFDDLNFIGSYGENKSHDISGYSLITIAPKYSYNLNQKKMEYIENSGTQLGFYGGSGALDAYRFFSQKTRNLGKINRADFSLTGRIGIGANKIDMNENRLDTAIWDFKGNPEDNDNSFFYKIHEPFGFAGLTLKANKGPLDIKLFAHACLHNSNRVFPDDPLVWELSPGVVGGKISYETVPGLKIVTSLITDFNNNKDTNFFGGLEAQIFKNVWTTLGVGQITDSSHQRNDSVISGITIKR